MRVRGIVFYFTRANGVCMYILWIVSLRARARARVCVSIVCFGMSSTHRSLDEPGIAHERKHRRGLAYIYVYKRMYTIPWFCC